MPVSCPRCGVGRMQPTQADFSQVYYGTLVQSPNVSAWRCDVCHYLQFEDDAVRQIDVLVGEAGPPPNRYAADAPPPTAPEVQAPSGDPTLGPPTK